MKFQDLTFCLSNKLLVPITKQKITGNKPDGGGCFSASLLCFSARRVLSIEVFSEEKKSLGITDQTESNEDYNFIRHKTLS